MKKLYVSLIAVALLGLTARAQETIRLDSLESAAYGATYVTIIDAEDLASFGAVTNATVAITSTVPAKVGLTMAGMILEAGFNDSIALGATGAITNSILLTVGDGSDADYFLTSTQIAADGTEVFVQFSPVASGTIAITPQTTLIYPAGTTNAGPAVMTNATAAFTGSRLGAKYYAASGSVVYTLVTAGDTVLEDISTGKLKIYWRELK